MIYAIVGSGGKTTLVHKMTEEFRTQGKRVFVTTSTHMGVEADTLLSDDPELLIRELEEKGYVMAGLPVLPKVLPEGMTLEEVIRHPVKMGAVSLATYEKVSAAADVTIIEADGSRGLPAKYPNETEPVIYDNVDEIIVVCGLHGLGGIIGEVTFRTDLVLKCLNSEMAGNLTDEIGQKRSLPDEIEQEKLMPDEAKHKRPVTDDMNLLPWHMQKLVREGFVKNMNEKYPDKAVKIYPTTDGSLYQRALAGLIKADLDVDLIKKEWFDPKPCLFIAGCGHVGKEVAEFGARLDFRVKVMDDRPELANEERFPMAEEVICDSFENIGTYAEENGYNVVTTYGHRSDFLCTMELMKKPFRYLGMIGSKPKVAHFHRQAAEAVAAGSVTEEAVKRVHAPIGLPIGGVTPAEIAISILAEIIQEKSKSVSSSTPQELLESDLHGTLCIIIEKSGSSPRGAGTMMLVTEDSVLGTVGGGKLESVAMEEARVCKEAYFKSYDLSGRDKDGLGMICGGNNTVLYIPV